MTRAANLLTTTESNKGKLVRRINGLIVIVGRRHGRRFPLRCHRSQLEFISGVAFNACGKCHWLPTINAAAHEVCLCQALKGPSMNIETATLDDCDVPESRGLNESQVMPME
jgi:hypothetical protein